MSQVQIISLTKELALTKSSEILELEHNWKAIGDEAWTKDNLLYEIPLKWILSHIAILDNKIVGYQIASKKDDVIYLNKIVVDQSKRGLGIGKKLLKEFLKKCNDNFFTTLHFKVRKDNDANKFYDKLGFTKRPDLDHSRPDGIASYFYDSNIQDLLKNFIGFIPHSKPYVDYDDAKEVKETILSGMHAASSKTATFENEISKLFNQKYAKAVSSGSTALHIALEALNITKGDEIILPSYVCQSLLNAIKHCNATPILVDVQDNLQELGFNISLDKIKPYVTNNTKAIIVPHMFGVPANILPIVKFAHSNNIKVIEDCALSLGAKINNKPVGSFGDITVCSFYATKIISTGQGGMVLTSNEQLFNKILDLLTYDKCPTYEKAFNFSITDIQTSLGLSQLKKLPQFINRRLEIAKKFNNSFNEFSTVPVYQKGSIPFRYIISLENENQVDYLKNLLKEKYFIASENPIFKPIHNYLSLSDENFPNTVKAQQTALSIPLYPALTDVEVDYIIKSVKKCLVKPIPN